MIPVRRMLAPLTNTQSHPDGTLSELELEWLRRRAAGGFDAVSTCAAYVDAGGKAWRGQLGIADDNHDAGLRRLADVTHAEGAALIVQLFHGGLKAELAAERIGPMHTPPAELERVTATFVAAARRAQRAGVDGVELHGANGYLFAQFLAPADNRRVDRWGRHLAGRARLLRETLRAVRDAVGATFTVGVRVSPVDTLERKGLVLDDATELVRWLADDGADYVHLSLRDASGPPPHEPGRGPVARAIRDALPSTCRLVVAGGVRTLADEQRAMAVGADAVAVGRAAIRHADWARQVDAPGFTPAPSPWTPAALAAQAVSPAFIDYLRRFPNLIIDESGD